MLHCIMTMTMTGGEEEEGDECARSVAEYPGTVRVGVVFPFSVATICRKLQLLSTDERVSGVYLAGKTTRDCKTQQRMLANNNPCPILDSSSDTCLGDPISSHEQASEEDSLLC